MRTNARRLLPVLAALAAGVLAFLLLRLVATGPFDDLEARQVAQDADRMRIGLDGQARLLTAFGVTNAIWDNSHLDIARGDRAAFTADFPPDAQHEANDLAASSPPAAVISSAASARFRAAARAVRRAG